MTILKHIRWNAVAVLFVGLGLAYGSGLIEREAIASSEIHFAHTASVMAAKLFTVAALFILIWAIESQRAKTTARLSEIEKQIAELKERAIAA